MLLFNLDLLASSGRTEYRLFASRCIFLNIHLEAKRRYSVRNVVVYVLYLY